MTTPDLDPLAGLDDEYGRDDGSIFDPQIDGRPKRKTNGHANGQHAEPGGDALYDLSHDGLALDIGSQWQRSARHVNLWGK